MKVLLLASGERMGSRALGAAVAAGAEVHVVCGAAAKGLTLSRRADGVTVTRERFDAKDPGPLVDEIDRLVRARGIDHILASDAPTTRFLIECRARLDARAFPGPDLATFDRLNNKWTFTQTAQALGLACPATRIFRDGADLARAARRGELAARGIVKPLMECGGAGVRRVKAAEIESVADTIPYRPILWQEHIPGLDISVSAYCGDGEIVASAAYQRRRGVFLFHDNEILHREMSVLVRGLGLTGIMNFDLIADPSFTRFHWLECNPRVFHSIEVMAMAGLNLIALGLGLEPSFQDALARDGIQPGLRMRTPRAALLDLLRFRPLAPRELRLLAHQLADPLAYGRERSLRALRRVKSVAARLVERVGERVGERMRQTVVASVAATAPSARVAERSRITAA